MDIVTREDWQQVAHDAGATSIDARNIRHMTATFATIAACEDATDGLMATGFSVSHLGCEVWGGPTYMQNDVTGEFDGLEVVE